MKFIPALTLMLIWLRLTNQTDMSWWLVWSPLALHSVLYTLAVGVVTAKASKAKE